MNSEWQSLQPQTQQELKSTMNAMQPPQSIEEIKAGLETTEKGGVRQSIRNCLTVFQRDPLLSGAIAYNILTDRKDIIKPIGFHRESTALNDTDMKYLLLYGLTAYVDTEYQIEVDGSQRSIFLKTNDVVLDKSFIEPENIRKLCGKRRFTLAHECAHQILFQLDSDDRKIACHKRPEVRKKGSRVLRTQEDWNEWQANSLGAAILMPQSEVDRAMWFINSRKPLTCYGWRFYNKDQVKIDTFCGVFGVSRSAAAIRLEQLGYLNRKKDYEYRDPLEVWP